MFGGFRAADGYFHYPEGEVGYPVTVPGQGGRHTARTKVRRETDKLKDEENTKEQNLKEPVEEDRRSSIYLYQSVDEDHPDLQSIQNIVANMTFSAD